MRAPWSVLVVSLIAASLLGLAPPARAQIVCVTEEQEFNTLDGPSDHTFACPVFFDAYLVLANNLGHLKDETGFPIIAGTPARFVACMVPPEGAEVECEEACGQLLKQKVPADIQVRVHVSLSADPACLTLLGAAYTVFADE